MEDQDNEIGMIKASIWPFYMENGFLHFVGKTKKANPGNFPDLEKIEFENQSVIFFEKPDLSDENNHKGKRCL